MLGVSRGEPRVDAVAAGAFDPRIHQASDRVEDDADTRFAVTGEAEAHAEVGVAVDEVSCAIYRIDDEGRVVREFHAGFEGLLAVEAEGGVFGEEGLGDEGFDRAVGFGDEVGGVELGGEGRDRGSGRREDHGAGEVRDGDKVRLDPGKVDGPAGGGGAFWSGLEGHVCGCGCGGGGRWFMGRVGCCEPSIGLVGWL